YLRYFHAARLTQRVAHDRLTRICFLDYDREIALLAERTDPATGAEEIIAVGRMSKTHGRNSAELAVLVRDQYQHRGLGIEILRRLIAVARDENVESVHAYLLQENFEMQALVRKVGFRVTPTDDPGVLFASFNPKDMFLPTP
ncbi:MAG: GNAT family N-acetyltransferase, partial [Candidatus Acidiferrales bacterium]